MPPAPDTPAERLAALLARLTHHVVTRHLVGLLAAALAGPLIDRLRGIKQRIARIAALVEAGRYKPRIIAAPARRGPGKPGRPDRLPRRAGWLLRLVPDSVGPLGHLEALFRDPAMAELMAAAPAGFGRPLRSLCRMLGVEVPKAIAPPARPPRPRPARPPKPAPPPPPPRPEPPAWMRIGPPRKPWSLTRMRGPRKRP
jgi:hypothetical protein